MSLSRSRSRRLRGAVALAAVMVCLLGTTAAHARTKWVVHDGGTITGVATTAGGGDFDVCDDAVRGLAGWSQALSSGEDPTTFPIPPSTLTPVSYEIFSAPAGVDLFVDDTGTEPRVGWIDSGGDFHEADLAATFTTPNREAPDPIEIGTDWYVFTTAPFSSLLTGVQAGETVGVKPHPGSAGATVAEFDAVDCGDSGFLRWWERDRDFCLGTANRVLTGDVTGDGRSDLLCQVPATGKVAVSTAGTFGAFTASLTRGDGPGLCQQAGTRLLLADTDGNGRDDLVCHNPATGKVAVALARSGGRFVGSDWSGMPGLCVGSAPQVVAGDVNGDGRADLVCHKPGSGAKQVALANGQGRFPDVDWTGNAGFCRDTSVVPGDVNGDGRTDLLCHRDSGSNAVALARTGGRFGAADWQSTLARCAAPFQVTLGAANGDRRADLICHAPLSGAVRLATATKAGRLPSVTFERRAAACNDPSTRLLVGDSSGDGRSDLICHQVTTGYVSAFFSDA